MLKKTMSFILALSLVCAYIGAYAADAPEASDCPFDDVLSDSWYGGAVLWAYENGITRGTSDTAFSPGETLTRGQLITLLWRVSGEPGKTESPIWYADAEKWASEQSLTKGTTAPYETDAPCPRGDTVMYLQRVFGE